MPTAMGYGAFLLDFHVGWIAKLLHITLHPRHCASPYLPRTSIWFMHLRLFLTFCTHRSLPLLRGLPSCCRIWWMVGADFRACLLWHHRRLGWGTMCCNDVLASAAGCIIFPPASVSPSLLLALCLRRWVPENSRTPEDPVGVYNRHPKKLDEGHRPPSHTPNQRNLTGVGGGFGASSGS